MVYGCGAALSRRPNERLLNIAFEAGVNVFDVGYSGYYGDAEKNLGAWAKHHRDEIFLISKGPAPVGADDEVDTKTAQRAATGWTMLLNKSLTDLDTEHVDAYYQMAANNPGVVRADEMYRAFEDAKAAGKVTYLGLSTHENAQEVLEAATETGWYDLAMIAITPAGWYDWNKREILPGSDDMSHLAPVLQQARDAGIGLVGMKVGRLLAGRRWGGGADGQGIRPLLRRVTVLEGRTCPISSAATPTCSSTVMDVVNADIQNYAILKENFVAAATAEKVFRNIA